MHGTINEEKILKLATKLEQAFVGVEELTQQVAFKQDELLARAKEAETLKQKHGKDVVEFENE